MRRRVRKISCVLLGLRGLLIALGISGDGQLAAAEFMVTAEDAQCSKSRG